MPLLQVTRPSDLCWQISFDSAPDNRLTDDMFAQLAAAMDQVEYEWRSQSQSKAILPFLKNFPVLTFPPDRFHTPTTTHGILLCCRQMGRLL
jgi:hypothetical protein